MDAKPKIALARKLRKAMTPPEWLLWQRLKTRHDGIVFKRQQPFGPYILDFYCFKAGLAIEVDGTIHGDDVNLARDEKRDGYLTSKGLFVYRIPAFEIYRNADAAADGVRLMVDELIKREQ